MSNKSPSKMGPYVLEHRIGRGGMGAVFAGWQENTHTPVAVKVLSSLLSSDESFRLRFEQEIEALRQLRHPNIIRLYGYGQEEETFYFSMELIEGNSLEEEIASGRRFSWKETLAMAIQICSALRCAHDHGIIHRDLKPGNLLLTSNGTVKLSDFGIATLFGGSKLTDAGSVMGTIEYMAPEQATAQPVTARTDLYSFGAVLVSLMAGHPPFQGKNLADIVHQHTLNKARRPSQMGVRIPPQFDELIGRLLERDPEKRPKTAFMLLRQLEMIANECTDEAVATFPVVVSDEMGATPAIENVVLENGRGKDDHWYASFGEEESKRAEDAQAERASQETGVEPMLPGVVPSVMEKTPQAEFSALGVRRFVEVGEENASRGSHFWETPWGGLAAILVATAFFGLAAAQGIAWWTTPPEADVLYHRIMQVADDEKPSDPIRYAKNIQLFLNVYPNDPRSAKVQELQTELDLDRLEKRLRANSRTRQFARSVHPVERDYQNAIHNLPNQPAVAMKNLEAFVTFYDAASERRPDNILTQEDIQKIRQYLEVAKRQLFRVRQILLKESEMREKLLEQERKHAQSLLESEDSEMRERGQALQEAMNHLLQE
ncbi:MAG: serine/threonine-protein kinase [Planctomycetia bacterium]|nr:serine/threonine-protein kinase [Planctomycetia bacterium]